jgi:hypothetical protein
VRALIAFTTLAGLGLTLFPGCGSSGGAAAAPTVPVKGKVTYKGKPVTQGQITFEPTDSGREAHGEIKPDGTFELSTFKPGDGAVTGTHKVTVKGAGRGVRPRGGTQVEVSEGSTEYAVELQ